MEPDKKIGLALVLAACVIVVFEFLLLRTVSYLDIMSYELVVLSIPFFLLSLGMFVIGGKLLVRPSLRLVTIDELRRRIGQIRTTSAPTMLPVLVYLCGIDGSGKTTQTKLLATKLRARGLAVTSVWFRWVGFFSYPLLGLARLLGYTKWMTIKGTSILYHEHYFDKNRAIAMLVSWFFLVDMWFYSFFRSKIPMATHDVLLCDRFVLDGIVDLICDTGDHNIPHSMVGKLLISLIPKRSMILLLDLPEQDAYERKKDIPHLEYLIPRRQLFLKLAKELHVSIVDAKKSPEALNNEIMEDYLSSLPQLYVHY